MDSTEFGIEMFQGYLFYFAGKCILLLVSA